MRSNSAEQIRIQKDVQATEEFGLLKAPLTLDGMDGGLKTHQLHGWIVLFGLVLCLLFGIQTCGKIPPSEYTSATEPVTNREVVLSKTNNGILALGNLPSEADSTFWTTPLQSQISKHEETTSEQGETTPLQDSAVPEKVYFSQSPSNSIDWVWVPPGSFILGSAPIEPGRRTNEGPQTQVTLSYVFWVSRYEVTVRQFGEIMGVIPKQPFSRAPHGLDNALRNVSWEEACDFCSVLTARERKSGTIPVDYVCRLPTEAEWEYSCRAGTETAFSFGDYSDGRKLADFGWYIDNSDSRPHAPGEKLPNRWGIYDTHGNVSEWCLDVLGQYPGGTLLDPVGTIDGRTLAIRSGSWAAHALSCRSAWRHMVKGPTSVRLVTTGFRPVIGPELRR